MLRNQSSDQRVCLTVAHLDGLVLARCGFNHSADYRAVMVFGNAYLVTDPEEKKRALVAMVDRLFPDRTAGLRQTTAQEIKATSVIAMEIEEASAKIRALGVVDDDEDYDLPVYAERTRSARCSVRRSRVHGCATASNDRHRCAGIRKAACSKKRYEMPIFCNTLPAEIGLGCALSLAPEDSSIGAAV